MNAVNLYALSDMERFPAFYEEAAAKRPSTLFYADFKTAERCGGFIGVIETMQRCGISGLDKDEWRKGLEARYTHYQITELIVVLNHLIWEAYEAGNEVLQRYYQRRYEFIKSLVPTWSEEEQKHYFYTTD